MKKNELKQQQEGCIICNKYLPAMGKYTGRLLCQHISEKSWDRVFAAALCHPQYPYCGDNGQNIHGFVRHLYIIHATYDHLTIAVWR